MTVAFGVLDARRRFSELTGRAERGEEIIVTRPGRMRRPHRAAGRDRQCRGDVRVASTGMNLQTRHDLSRAAIAARDDLAAIEPLRIA